MFNQDYINTFKPTNSSGTTITTDNAIVFRTADYYSGYENNKNAIGNKGSKMRKKAVQLHADVQFKGILVAKNVPLKSWCETMKLSYNALADVARGSRQQYKGYTAQYCKAQPEGVRKYKTKKSGIHYVEHALCL